MRRARRNGQGQQLSYAIAVGSVAEQELSRRGRLTSELSRIPRSVGLLVISYWVSFGIVKVVVSELVVRVWATVGDSSRDVRAFDG
jgi:hypothetical protein